MLPRWNSNSRSSALTSPPTHSENRAYDQADKYEEDRGNRIKNEEKPAQESHNGHDNSFEAVRDKRDDQDNCLNYADNDDHKRDGPPYRLLLRRQCSCYSASNQIEKVERVDAHARVE